jgi:hypothetical protein
MPNYAQIERELIPMLKPFKHSDSMSAKFEGDNYVVYSYSTIIAEFDTATGKWTFNETKYSVTTSRQQNLVKRAVTPTA